MHFLYYPAVPFMIPDAPADKYRAQVGGSERLKLSDDIVKTGIDIPDLQFSVYFNNRMQGIRLYRIFYDLLKSLAEGGQVAGIHGHSGSKIVSAIVVQQVAALVYGFIDIEAAYGARRPCNFTIGFGKDNGRFIIMIDKAGSYNSHYTFMPVRPE